MTIYLYIKTHRITGLKYFGMTRKKDVCRYRGSGKYWISHIAKHGYYVDTEIIGIFKNTDEGELFALTFSKENNIVKSDEWANLILENCRGGGGLSGEKSHLYGKKPSEETRERIRQLNFARKGEKQSPEWIEKRTRKIRPNNTSGLVGVCWHKIARKWTADIMCNGKRRRLGLFEDKEKAHAAYLAAKAELNINPVRQDHQQ